MYFTPKIMFFLCTGILGKIGKNDEKLWLSKKYDSFCGGYLSYLKA
jgi:hypothetical protein